MEQNVLVREEKVENSNTKLDMKYNRNKERGCKRESFTKIQMDEMKMGDRKILGEDVIPEMKIKRRKNCGRRNDVNAKVKINTYRGWNNGLWSERQKCLMESR